MIISYLSQTIAAGKTTDTYRTEQNRETKWETIVTDSCDGTSRCQCGCVQTNTVTT